MLDPPAPRLWQTSIYRSSSRIRRLFFSCLLLQNPHTRGQWRTPGVQLCQHHGLLDIRLQLHGRLRRLYAASGLQHLLRRRTPPVLPGILFFRADSRVFYSTSMREPLLGFPPAFTILLSIYFIRDKKSCPSCESVLFCGPWFVFSVCNPFPRATWAAYHSLDIASSSKRNFPLPHSNRGLIAFAIHFPPVPPSKISRELV